MSSPIRMFFEIIWLYCKGFRPVEFVRDADRVSLHPSGWRMNGSGKFKRAKDAVSYLESSSPEQWRQIYCGMTPFLVSDKGNVKHVDGSPVKMNLANGRYQIMYKPEDPRGRGKDGRIHKKRVYRSMLVAMAWLDFHKGDVEHEIHHINGYRTDDRVANLMVVDHKEHLRIHNLGPCALSGLPDERIVDASAGCEDGKNEPETYAGSHVALKAENGEQDHAPRKKKRRRGKRGGKGRTAAQTEQDACETQVTSADDASKDAAEPKNAAIEQQASSKTTPATIEQPTAPEPVPEQHIPSKAATEQHTPGETPDEQHTSNEAPIAHANRPRENNAKSPRVAKAKKRTGASGKDASEPKPESAADWAKSRARLSDSLDAFLDALKANDADHTVDEKEANKAAKPVYRALKPYLTCPDPVAAFDAALSCIRTIAQAYRDSGAEIPAPVHSMLGTLHQVVKDAVKRIAAEGDAVEIACLRELLVDEAAKPLFKKTMHARKFRQCISVVDSRNEPESEQA